MKKVLISVGIIGIVAALAIGATIAYYSDTETSEGNIFTAGSVDLKVDHVKQTYNGVNCLTCDVEIMSDTSNEVVATVDGSDPTSLPHDAVKAWEHSVWVDPPVGAEWIWATNPTMEEDAEKEVEYHFENTFEWYGPIIEADLEFVVASDNSVEVFLNGNPVGGYPGEQGYSQLTSISIDPNYVNQGENVVRFEVTNHEPDWQAEEYQYTNPGGLAYKLTIDGNCEGDYFKENCTLFGEKDLEEGDHFFVFDDIKPGDWGTNLISLHSYENDAWACLVAHDGESDEGGVQESELPDNDEEGELQDYINFFAWVDDGDGEYESGETQLGVSTLGDLGAIASFDSKTGEYLTGTSTEYIGLAWCAGDISLNESDEIVCDGNGMANDAQTDSFTASLTAYAEQWRNNSNFDCGNVILE